MINTQFWLQSLDMVSTFLMFRAQQDGLLDLHISSFFRYENAHYMPDGVLDTWPTNNRLPSEIIQQFKNRNFMIKKIIAKVQSVRP